MISVNELRSMFLNYFSKKNHKVIKSSSLIPGDDPSLMFVNAGMVQFKNIFLGIEDRSYKRATSAQKCLRVSGKHNDFEAVGRTPRHHTFFEMLGNFSFGDYFKKDAIKYAWDFITSELKLPKDKLWVTVYKEDKETYELWLKLTDISKDHIIYLGEKDNFWSMGEVGPCGPCTEIHYDKGDKFTCGPECALGFCECDRFMEIWNLVFMEYNRDKEGNMTPLPRPSVDTGMGLERVASILQGVDSNYETDLFKDIIIKIEEITEKKYDVGDGGVAFRVIADHIRSSVFLISDGVFPSNEGRGYVLRRILRRAIRFGYSLEVNETFMYKLVDVVILLMKDAYPELKEKSDYIKKVIINEETRFLSTLQDGIIIANNLIDDLIENKKDTLSGENAFLLHDTFGFPLELTRDLCEERNVLIDDLGFEVEMKRHKDLARKNGIGSNEEISDDFNKNVEALARPIFHYNENYCNGKIIGLFNEKGEKVTSLLKDKNGIIFINNTVFYGEGGGQVGDTGEIFQNGNLVFKVNNTKKTKDGKIFHEVTQIGDVSNEEVILKIDNYRRMNIARNHSCTHLLHKALQSIIGEHATQKGSYVTDSYFRFDFSHFEGLTKEEIVRIEDLVNDMILEDVEVVSENISIEEAKKSGAMAIFGEKYGEEVRVVSMGDKSKELCGGTHVFRTGEIGSLKIMNEISIGSGLRRIEGITGRYVIKKFRELDKIINLSSKFLKTNVNDLPEKINNLSSDLKIKNREILELKNKLINKSTSEINNKIQKINGVNLVFEFLGEQDMEDLRAMSDVLKSKIEKAIIVLVSEKQERVNLLVAVDKSLAKSEINANKIIKEIAPLIGGGGGGRPELAQAGGKNPKGISLLEDRVKELLVKMEV